MNVDWRPIPPYTNIYWFLTGRGVAEDSAVSPLAVKQNGALINDSLSTRCWVFSELESYLKVTPLPLYPNMGIN